MKMPDLGIYKFVVKEGDPSISGADDAPVSLACEPIDSELSIIDRKGFLTLNLIKGASTENAIEVAAYLQKWIESIGYAKIN